MNQDIPVKFSAFVHHMFALNWKNIATNMVARGILSFGTLGGATDPKIKLCQKYFCQFSADIWWTNAENFREISWFLKKLLPFNQIFSVTNGHSLQDLGHGG